MRSNSRNDILEAARRLFLRFGYNGVSMRAIAKEAGITTGAVYFHFRRKSDIYAAVCLEAGDMLIQRFREGMAASSGPNRKLISIFDSFMSFFHEKREYYNILMEHRTEYRESDDSRNDEIMMKMAGIVREIDGPLRMGMQNGTFRDIDPGMTSLLLAIIAEGLLQYKRIGLLDYLNVRDGEFRRFMADVVGRGIQANARKGDMQ
jgi:AcrR family transcriptional regulator